MSTHRRRARRPRFIGSRTAALAATILTAALLTTPTTATGAYFTKQAALTGNSITAATLGAVTNPTATSGTNAVTVSWDAATGQNWAKSNNITTGVTYTVTQTLPDGTTSTAYTGTSPTATVTRTLQFTQISAQGSTGFVALTTDGHVYQWGGNAANMPRLVPNLKNIKYLSASTNAVFAIDTSNVIYGWGTGQYGIFGNGSTADLAAPTPLTLWPSNVTQIASTLFNTYMLTSDGSVYSVGVPDSGALGNGRIYEANSGQSDSPQTTPVQVNGISGATEIAAGMLTGYALQGGRVLGWGSNDYGQIGNGTTQDQAYAQYARWSANAAMSGVTHIAAQNFTAYAVAPSGAWGWGYDIDGEAGDGSSSNQVYAQSIGNSNQAHFNRIFPSYYGAYATTTDGSVYSWGVNDVGQAGFPNAGTPQKNPSKIPTLSNITVMSAGYNSACALQGTQAMCWGSNSGGNLGLGFAGGSYDHPVPTVQGGLAPVPGSTYTITYSYQQWTSPSASVTK